MSLLLARNTSRRFVANVNQRYLSTASPPSPSPSPAGAGHPGHAADMTQSKENNEQEQQLHPQDFVKIRFEPGEWDPARRDPLHLPPFRSRARIISAEDFAARPRVGFSEEFESLHDAMVTLSWINAKQSDGIYQLYLDMMSSSSSRGQQATSHEYVMRVIAQKYNITPSRVAAIVQLAHNEEQLRKKGVKIDNSLQDYVDQKIATHIAKAYGEYQEVQPRDLFVEDPRGITGQGEPGSTSSSALPVSDLIDVDKVMDATVKKEKEDARFILDTHIYKEDVDEFSINVGITNNCHKMIETRSRMLHEGYNNKVRLDRYTPMPGGTTQQKPRRPRWKYVAKFIDTRENKKSNNNKNNNNKKKNRKKSGIIDNILVEHDGVLRVASVGEAKQTAWKPKRNTQEFIYGGVKQAWLDRTLNGAQGVWGRQQAPLVVAKDDDQTNKPEKETETDAVASETTEQSGKEDNPDNVVASESTEEKEEEKDKKKE